ncbi:hypothetical protein [Granulosicoccus antarcticus]|uniref:DUF4394 domain-containing protein n=1 Tax=Granulosicoccus antarcticus IMCC3135 TaxID=1192854 RepID=A0A2Z2NTQ2_9GAMM|nr:hypothetical protein [Granulosicoccus antarcticus]ASJ74932.1 hypothetical protein IMCC3135_24325 [Granulosicoccus antarcticus IMCC3135]
MKTIKSTSKWPIAIARTSIAATLILTLAACSSDDDDNNTVVPDDNDVTDALPGDTDTLPDNEFAFVSTRAADYGSGRVDRISLTDGYIVDGNYPGALSNISVATDGTSPYQIGKFSIDSVTRYDATDLSIVDYQYSVKGDEPVTSNPQSIAFSGENKAYLTRRSSNSLWVVDPEAISEAEFKLDELDLSAYDVDMPDMTDAIIVDDKLFVLMERLNRLESGSQIIDKTAYIAVFNTITDTEIDTEMGSDGLLGIELLVTNPTSLQYNEETGMIYVVGRGNYYENEEVTGDFHSGGVQSIDPTSYAQTLLLDDGTDAENEGYFVEVDVINDELAYLLTYAAFGETTLRSFNPSTGVLSDEIMPELNGADITTIATGSDNHLWIGINDDTPGFYRLDLATGELLADRIATELVPMNVVFISAPQQ